MEVKGGLLKAMQEVISDLAVLVIDETNSIKMKNEIADPNNSNFSPMQNSTAYQQKVIMLAQSFNCPIFLIQFDTRYACGSFHYVQNNDDKPLSKYLATTKKSLRALLPHNTRVINKHHFNAFVGTNLAMLLAQENRCNGVKNLVVMGYDSEVCVPETIGIRNKHTSRNKYNEYKGPGAIGLGFSVLTCQSVLTGGPATWARSSQSIKFYDHI